MVGKIKLTVVFFIGIILLVSLATPSNASGTGPPGIEFGVTPSQKVIVKPENSNAEGALNVHLAPRGSATSANREPIDVVFIFDKSGSMNDSGKNPDKFKSAKDAMKEAVTFFKENAGPNDKFAFIPFASDVEHNKIVYFSLKDINAGLDKIEETVESLPAVGGTNYTQSFEKALEMLEGSQSRNKSIIFMTDGEPTFSQNTERVNERVCVRSFILCLDYDNVNEDLPVHYELYGQGKSMSSKVYFTYKGKTFDKGLTVADTQKAIKQHGTTRADLLAKNNIKLYSIGFGNDTEVDMKYLRELSSITGVAARQASPETISGIFQDISKDVDTPSISGEVRIDLSKFDGNVDLIEGSNARIDGNMVTAKFSFNFPLNQSAPQPIDLSLPFSFSEIGTYTFDNIVLSYNDINGQPVTPKKHAPVDIEVKPDAPPTFKGSMELKGEVNSSDNLIKYSTTNSSSNVFNVNYSLVPQGLVDNMVKGNISNVTIIQPLPEGISVIPTNGVTLTTTEDGRPAVQVPISTAVDYSKGAFNPNKLTATLKLKGDWALNNVKMPLATLTYTDSRFGNQSTTIPSANQFINLKVRLPEFPDMAYDGDASGNITKVDLNNNGRMVAQTEFPNIHGLKNKAIKDLKFMENGNVIEVSYYDNDKVQINLVTDFELIGKDTGEVYHSGEKSTEPIQVNLSKLIPGKGLKYFYSIENSNKTVEWTEFTPEDSILISLPGEYKISVKTVGGFSVHAIPISKIITIEKQIETLEISPEIIEVEVGKSKSFEVDIQPLDASNQDLDIKVFNENIATLINNRTIFGVSEGETELIVRTTDGSNIEVRVKIIVKDPYKVLDNIKFTKAVYKIAIGEKIPINDILIFNPDEATDKEIIEVISSMSNVVTVVRENKEWIVTGKDIGYSTVKARAEEQKGGKYPEASALFEVVNSGEVEEDGPLGEGRW